MAGLGEVPVVIEVRCFSSLDEAAVLRDDVNALNLDSARPDPFSTFEFFENFYKNDEFFPGGRGLKLWFLTAFSVGRLVGYLVLKQVPRRVLGMRTTTLDFLVAHDTDRPHVVARPEYMGPVSEAFYAYVLGRKQEWSLLEFEQQDENSSLFPPPAAIDLKGLRVRRWPSLENSTVHVRWGTIREYFKALSKKFRSNVGRNMRSLLTAGEVQLLSSSDPTTTPALFELYRSIEPRSWKSRANAYIGRHPKRVEFCNGLLDVRQPMQLSIHVLLLDGIPIAGLINGAFLRGLYALHIVYDERLSRLGPGSAMLLVGMRQAIDGNFAFFNLLSGFGYFKARWLAQITETRIAQIYRVDGVLYWRRVLGDWKRRLLARGAQPTPELFNRSRREVGDPAAGEAQLDTAGNYEVSANEREHIATLIAQVRQGKGEFLSTAELVAVMPMETTTSSKAVPGR
jgi:hypothetical protein